MAAPRGTLEHGTPLPLCAVVVLLAGAARRLLGVARAILQNQRQATPPRRFRAALVTPRARACAARDRIGGEHAAPAPPATCHARPSRPALTRVAHHPRHRPLSDSAGLKGSQVHSGAVTLIRTLSRGTNYPAE